MPVEQSCAVSLLRARTAIIGALLHKAPAFGPARPHWYSTDAVAQFSAEADFHVLQLATALRFARPGMYARHVRWLRVVLTHRGLADKAITQSLRALVGILGDILPPDVAPIAAGYVRAALTRSAADDEPPAARPTPLQLECVDALLAAQPAGVEQLASAAGRCGLDGAAYCVSVLGPAMHEVGRLWEQNAISVDQEHQCAARAADLLSRLVVPAPAAPDARRAVCACITGERHELGIRMVANVLRANGWSVTCPNQEQDPSGLLREVIARRAQLVAISATMLQHLSTLESIVAAIRAMAECADLKVLVGGQAFDAYPGVWNEIGADATAADAIEALAVANRLVPARAR
jgi:methanogenic corrinoid protein MtbC1